MARVDFSRNAPFYDRRHGAVAGRDVLEDVARVAGLHPGLHPTAHTTRGGDPGLRDGAVVLDVGAGTGRVSVALAGIGCHVVAIEPALPMLECLRGKATGLDVAAVVGEGAHLPFPDASFDGVVLARVLYLMTDWRDVLSEVARVSRAHAPLLHEWGNGGPDEEWVQIRAMARALFEQAGVKEPFHPGARSETEVDEFLAGLGYVQAGQLRAAGTLSITVGEFLRRIIDGECSYTWNVPTEILGPCLAELRAWTIERYGLDRLILTPREIGWKVFQRRPSADSSESSDFRPT
jgi:SAM-dependent methyltransferase